MKHMTHTQRDIITMRGLLSDLHYQLTGGMLDAYDSETERLAQEGMVLVLTTIDRMRKEQQEVFDRHPTFAASCIRV